jgi:hypothetical protein
MKRLLYADVSASQASVHFQNRINQMLISVGANIQQLDILTPQDQGAFTKIGLRMAVTLTQRELLKFLSLLQDSDKLYIVSAATLRSNDDLRIKSEPQLFFQAEMSAYLEGGLP